MGRRKGIHAALKDLNRQSLNPDLPISSQIALSEIARSLEKNCLDYKVVMYCIL